jgi:hypothetical protein
MPLVIDNKTKYMLIEYQGDESIKFRYLLKHILTQLNFTFYTYQGKKEDKIQVFIKADDISLAQATKELEKISSLLIEKLSKKWKLLPSDNLPLEYNIATLPYKELSF